MATVGVKVRSYHSVTFVFQSYINYKAYIVLKDLICRYLYKVSFNAEVFISTFQYLVFMELYLSFLPVFDLCVCAVFAGAQEVESHQMDRCGRFGTGVGVLVCAGKPCQTIRADK